MGFMARLRRRQIIPAASTGADAVNFRSLRESRSLQLEGQQRVGECDGEGDLFRGFSSVTLHYDGEDG